jgi:hypothetical protein
VSRPEHLQALSCQVLQEINRHRLFELEITSLRSFDLDPDLLRVDEHREIIFEALKRNKSLVEITSYNGIESTYVCRAISSLLQAHPAITTLIFEFRQLEAEGADNISEGICSNSTITSLDICYGGRDPLRANYSRLIAGLSTNRSVTRLRVEVSSSLEVLALSHFIHFHARIERLEITLVGEDLENGGFWIAIANALQSKPALELAIICHPNRFRRITIAMERFLLPLKNCQQFKTLAIILGTINDQNWRSVSDFLHENMHLREFRATGMNLDLGYRADLTLALKSSSALETLNFSLCGMSTDSCIALGDIIRSSRSITSLNLANCNIGKQNIKFITRALQYNSTIKTIVLNGNNVQNEGCREIAKLLQNNRTLTSLAMQMNNYSNGGLAAICNSLKENKFLQRLSFGTPMAMLDGFKSIRDMVQTNRTLEHLDISNCQCVRDVTKLIDGLKSNSAVTSLTMHLKIHYDVVRPLFEELFAVNRAITSMRLLVHDIYRGPNAGEIKAYENNNKEYQRRIRSDLAQLVRNIRRGIASQTINIPWEIWRKIFSGLEYPGIKNFDMYLKSIK